ncbi:hypothetical protein HMP06_2191 [Sphingomonas sp. HMP6]|nr:hypothetical protein HMP06_2191 [Sphingomonas sp. HMP6]
MDDMAGGEGDFVEEAVHDRAWGITDQAGGDLCYGTGDDGISWRCGHETLL